MDYPDDLLRLAGNLASISEGQWNQASLRRAVSTGYYALFHLLISEAAMWVRPELRPALGRVFDHGPMKQASDRKMAELNNLFKSAREGPERRVAYHLYRVAEMFVEAQYERNEADYNMARQWTPPEVQEHLSDITEAFQSWKQIREEPEAQAFLVSLLPSKERRGSERPRAGGRPNITG